MNRIFNIDAAMGLLLAPILAAQTAWVYSKAIRMPEPTGSRSGSCGCECGPELKLLVLGDSSAAGVGVPTQDQALTSQLANQLALAYRVNWQLCARNGATTADAPELLEAVGTQNFDVAYVIFGVNDTKNLRSEAAWRRDLTSIVSRLRHQHHVPYIFLSGLPPVKDFPLLPNPLRTVFALRAARFGRAMQQVAARDGCIYLPVDSSLEQSNMAVDGFHPGPLIYSEWAERAASEMLNMINRKKSVKAAL